MIQENVIIPFDGDHADIPAGFVRETSLDGLYPKGSADGVNPNVTGGNSTHTHTSPTHTHTLAGHTHTGATPSQSFPNDNGLAGHDYQGMKSAHAHNYTTSSGISGGTTNDTAVTYSTISNDPPYYTVIFIKATGNTTIPNNAMVLKEGTSRTDLIFHTSSADKFLKGAATSANAGSTGGSTTNVHSVTHTHTTNTHTHSNFTTALPAENRAGSDGGTGHSQYIHTHTGTTAAGTQAINSYSTDFTCAETVQPAYKKINAFKNESGSSVTPAVGDIGLWLGTLANIPIGWNLCDGTNNTPDMRSKFLKINSSATTTSTGGSNTHSHAAKSHTHTSSGSHTHTVTFSNDTGNVDNGSSEDSDHLRAHGHNSDTSSATAPTYAATNITANSSNNEPEYRTVAYIQYEFTRITKTITAGASIKNNVTETIEASSDVKKEFSKNISAIADLKSNITRTVSAVGKIGSVQRIFAKGDIKHFSTEKQISALAAINKKRTKTISALSNIKVTTQQEIEAKGSIFRTGIIGQPSFGGLTLPFPDYADISPEWGAIDNTALKGKTRRGVMSRKYQYQFKWNTMKVEYYNNLELIANSLEASQFVYGKWPQSREGVICLGSLSPRKLTYKDGDSVYLSSVILILIEVESRI